MIFITGASGVIGQFLVPKLLNLGYKLRCLKRNNSKINDELNNNKNIEWVEGDITDYHTISAFLDGIETVIHCAALVSFNRKDKALLFKTNVEGTENLVNASLENKVGKFIHISSIASIGEDKNKEHQDEKNQWEANEKLSDYANSKYLAEKEVWRANAEGLATTILNPSVILSLPEGRSSAKMVQQMMKHNPFIPNAEINTVDVRDVVNIILESMTRKEMEGERFIITNDKPVKLIDLYNQLRPKTTQKSRLVNLKMLRLAYYIDTVISALTLSQQKLDKEILKLKTNTSLYNNRKLKKYINYNYQSIEETCKWIVHNTNENYAKECQMT